MSPKLAHIPKHMAGEKRKQEVLDKIKELPSKVEDKEQKSEKVKES